MMRRNALCKRVGWAAIAALACALAMPAWAGDFDGKKALICAPVEVNDCISGAPCLGGTPSQMGAPSFLRIDFSKSTVTGPHNTAKIASVEKVGDQLVLQGFEVGHAFAIAIDRESGRMTTTLASTQGAFVLFGSCTTQ